MPEIKNVCIVGAGLVGSLLASLLAKKGYKVDVFEGRGDMRGTKLSAGRSINMACSTRGWKALDLVGAGDRIRETAIPMSGRTMHSEDGTLSNQPYGAEDQAIYSISRSGLNCILMDHAEENEQVKFHFNHKCIDIDLDEPRAIFETEKGDRVEVKPDLIFGTDGAFSSVRKVLQKLPHFDYSQTYISHDYKELVIPAKNGAFQMDKNTLHIWPRGSHMLIALPNPDGSFTCTLFLPYEGENSFAQLNSEKEITTFFTSKFPDALAMMPELVEVFKENPTSPLVIVRCFPWSHNGKVGVLGDASHAIVPFYGQGMNSGFEDVSVLSELIDAHDHEWEKIFKAFEQERKPNADAIADLALKNFIEMRDLVGQPSFLKRKKIEHALSDNFPDNFISQYAMVSFSNIPYSEAVRRGDEQDKILDQLEKEEGILEMIDNGTFKTFATPLIQK
jgi:kynurenine 3-monooxygenase